MKKKSRPDEMFVGVVRVEVLIPSAFSLKDKRNVLRGVKDSVFSRTGVRIMELSGDDKWNFSSLGFAVVSSKEAEVKKWVEDVLRILSENDDIEVIKKGIDYFKYE
jgi:uncharacterized protein YlxP (DUF503 family)